MRRKSQQKNAHSIELRPETTARACSSLSLMNCHKNPGWTGGKWHFILLSFSLQGEKGGKKEPWEGIRHYEQQQHQNLKAQSSPSVDVWMERGSRKESWFRERNCSGAWKCLFFNCVSVGIYRLTLSWCKSVLLLHCSWFMAPEDLAPYFLLWACLPKAKFFTTFFVVVVCKWNYGLKTSNHVSNPEMDCSVKNPFAGGQFCGLLGQPCYSRCRSCSPREEFAPKGLSLMSSVLGNAAARSTHGSVWPRHPKEREM